MQRSGQINRRLTQGVAMIAVAGLVGCGYAKRDDVDAQFAQLRGEMEQEHQQIDGRVGQLDGRLNTLETRTAALERDLQAMREEFAAQIEDLEGMLAFNVPVNFEYDRADVRDQDRAVLDRFAAVVQEYYPGAVITVEGFTDPAGSAAYNRRLGERRATAVKDYLVQQGLLTDRIRTVSYGESADRLINDGRGPEAGLENRRVTLVIDYAQHGDQQGGARVITEQELDS
jgi:peptidoglycan-associated lipoprotein